MRLMRRITKNGKNSRKKIRMASCQLQLTDPDNHSATSINIFISSSRDSLSGSEMPKGHGWQASALNRQRIGDAFSISPTADKNIPYSPWPVYIVNTHGRLRSRIPKVQQFQFPGGKRDVSLGMILWYIVSSR